MFQIDNKPFLLPTHDSPSSYYPNLIKVNSKKSQTFKLHVLQKSTLLVKHQSTTCDSTKGF